MLPRVHKKQTLNVLVHFYEKFLEHPLKDLKFEYAKKQRLIPEVLRIKRLSALSQDYRSLSA
jgi:hypothetical protein